MKRLSRAVFLSLLFATTMSGAVWAQTNGSNATISGHVNDPQSANLPGATITLYGRERSFSLVTTSDSSGAYSFKHLAPGEYLVEAGAAGLPSRPRKPSC